MRIISKGSIILITLSIVAVDNAIFFALANVFSLS
jgi:hypothetical protein